MKLEVILENVLLKDNTAFFYTPPVYKNAKSIWFKSAAKIFNISNKSEFNDAFNKIDMLIGKGYTGYGTISYETGYLLEEKLNHLAEEEYNFPLLYFVICYPGNIETFESKDLEFDNIPSVLKRIKSPNKKTELKTPKEKYLSDIDKIKDYIKKGDTYQVNYTSSTTIDSSINVIELFLKMIFNQSAEYSAIINTGNEYIISSSPELFFKINGNKIITKPMKGTARRGVNFQDDENRREDLIHSDKDKAENIMIADMLRNDLGKISELGTVKVNKEFEIEKYESVYQAITEVEGTLKEKSFRRIMEAIYPSGSITGAPKIRTMEIINKLEVNRRNIYTGSIGLFNDNEITFNVAIRTARIHPNNKIEIGLGSGITWSSDAENEFNETLLKGKFINNPDDYFELFETMLIENRKIFLLGAHMERMKKSADFFLFYYNENKVFNYLDMLTGEIDRNDKYKLKLTLNKWGSIKHVLQKITDENENAKIVIAEERIDTLNKFQYFKTTNREFYNKTYNDIKENENAGFFDVIFLNENNEIAEGAITNIFIKKNNIWFTPPVSSGILPGTYRGFFMKTNQAIEKKLYITDLIEADEIILTNSVRKEVRVNSIYSQNKLIWESTF